MKRTALAFGAALALLGGCAPYATSGAYYGGGGGGYYQPDYYAPTVYAQPYGGTGGNRDHRGGDHANYRDHRDNDHGDRSNHDQGNTRGQAQTGNQGNQSVTRGNYWQLNQRQQNAASRPSGTQSTGGQSSGQSSSQSGGGRGFGHHRDN